MSKSDVGHLILKIKKGESIRLNELVEIELRFTKGQTAALLLKVPKGVEVSRFGIDGQILRRGAAHGKERNSGDGST